MVMWPKVLRLKRADKPSEHMLFSVSKNGSNELDLSIVGTDQEQLFRGSLREAKIKSIQAANFSGDLLEWKSIVAWVLLRQRPSGPLPERLQGVEAVATIVDSTATVLVRRNVSGITQRLGSINLEQFQDDVDLFEWINAAVMDSDGLRDEVETLQTSVTSLQDQTTRLKSELDHLVTAKKAHEEELIGKFAALLNSKKLKIRDQERLLRGSRLVDRTAAGDVSNARSQSSKVDKPRGAKRKADSSAIVQNENDELPAENGAAAEEDEDTRRQETPETDVDDDDMSDNGFDAPNSDHGSSQTKATAASQRSTASQHMHIDSKRPAAESTSTRNVDQDEETDSEAEDEL